MKIDILHTADWHLWHKHKYTRLIPGKHWDAMFEAKMDVLRNTFVPFVKKHKVNTFVIAGDIFQHYNPIEPVKKAFVELALEISFEVEGLVIITGNHDQYKGQHAFESIGELVPFGTNIMMYENEYYNDEYYVGHCGVDGFEANGGYIEKRKDLVVNKNKFKKYKLVLLGHYHKNQKLGNIYYSGSPYPCNFGEENEEKYFNVFVDEKCKRVKMQGIGFYTNIGLNGAKLLLEDCEYAVVRLKKECNSADENKMRQELIDCKDKILNHKKVLDCIIDFKIINENISNQINSSNKIMDYKEIIDNLEIDNKFKKYIFKKFEGVH